MTFEQFQAAGYVRELAKRYRDDTSAKQLLRAAGFPVDDHLKPFVTSPITFWTDVIEEAYKGLMPDPTTIVWAALDRHPFSDDLRTIARKPRPPAPAGRPQVRVLYVAANPLDTPQLNQPAEFKALQDRLKPATAAGLAHVESSWATKPDDVLGILRSYQPHVAHFSGHGRPDGTLELDDGRQHTALLAPAALTAAFADTRADVPVRVALFSACFSLAVARAVRPAVDLAVGMTEPISTDPVVAFTDRLYERLAKDLLADPSRPLTALIDAAVADGRAAAAAIPAGAAGPGLIVLL